MRNHWLESVAMPRGLFIADDKDDPPGGGKGDVPAGSCRRVRLNER